MYLYLYIYICVCIYTTLLGYTTAGTNRVKFKYRYPCNTNAHVMMCTYHIELDSLFALTHAHRPFDTLLAFLLHATGNLLGK